MNNEQTNLKKETDLRIDWLDIKVAIIIGLIYAPLKALELHGNPPWNIPGKTIEIIINTLCIAYILLRVQRVPEKLKEWGLTTPITVGALMAFIGLQALATISLAALSLQVGGSLSFKVGYVYEMIGYILGAFPQQFLVFAIGVSTLEKIPLLRGWWRVPLLTGAVFALGHFWSPAKIPGTFIPLQLVSTFPMGFLLAWYFIRFRTIIPLTAWHAINFVLLVNWVEKYI